MLHHFFSLHSSNFYPPQRLKSQKDFDEAMKERLAEIHVFMSAIEGEVAIPSGSLLSHPTIQSSIKELLQHAQEVISYVLNCTKTRGKGSGTC
jgi:hypothetical protein